MLKRKKPQNGSPPSTSPPPLDGFDQQTTSVGNQNNKDHNDHHSGKSKSNKHNKKDKKVSSSNGDNRSNSSTSSNPKKYQKSNNSSVNNNDLIDHHQHIVNNTNNNSSNNTADQSSSPNPLYDKEQLNLIKGSTSQLVNDKFKLESQDNSNNSSNNNRSASQTPSILQQSQQEIDFIPITSATTNNNNSNIKNNNKNQTNTNKNEKKLTNNNNSNNHTFENNGSNSHFNNSKEPYKHVPIWLEGVYSSKELSDLTLSKEIEHFVEWINPNIYENRLRQKLVKDVEAIIRVIWPNARIVIFGSFLSDLSLPSSDIDIQVNNIDSVGQSSSTSSSVYNNNFSYDPIRDLHSSLIQNHQNSFTNCRLISGAKVPIIKMQSKNTFYNIDICFNTPNGIENTVIVKSLLDKYKSMRTLLLVIKFFLFQNSLHETYTGGIGSYALALMVVSFIQLRYVPMNLRTHLASSKSRKNFKHAGDDTDYGAMLVEFFELYGRSFNYSLYGISLENGGFYFVKEEQWGTSLTLLDPHDRDNDVGRNSFNIPFIRGAFTNTLLKIISNEMLKDRYSKISFPTILSKIIEERLVEQIAKERNSVIKYGKTQEESNQLPPLVKNLDELIKNPVSATYGTSKPKSSSTTFVSVSSSDESSSNEKDIVTLDTSSSSEDNSSESENEAISLSSDDNNSYSDYSSSSDSEIESGANSSSPNHSNSSPISSDNEDSSDNKSSNHINQKKKSDPYGW
ncbi:PAP/25A-associated domain-containing protein [Tieghemostelium lacteum]|uniref:PAP/25A-associated domain-containing protein n=1 Tax=Tieghemostelium lacteum TaxID=361077 RepID=A0A151ZE18_TIELA|nr:PAP/25A-associated domain-containing protein [Tieghemostelium lacteum]|eukprot:KYQ92191.1 PAP/25A-associated domain-containing protein [Tieghemostelium lacteum]